MHVNNYLKISKKEMCIHSLHTSMCVTNVDAPSHKLFQIFEYGTLYGASWSLLSHCVRCHQKFYEVHHNIMLHFLAMCLVNMNAPVCTFINALHKNISDKGGVPCTLTTRCVICTLMHRPTNYMIFFGAFLNGCADAFMFTNAPPRKVTRYAVHPVNLHVAP
jgi:hypothetical protein